LPLPATGDEKGAFAFVLATPVPTLSNVHKLLLYKINLLNGLNTAGDTSVQYVRTIPPLIMMSA